MLGCMFEIGSSYSWGYINTNFPDLGRKQRLPFLLFFCVPFSFLTLEQAWSATMSSTGGVRLPYVKIVLASYKFAR